MFGFHTDVVIRSTGELRDVIARNPFADWPKRDPGRLVVMFLSAAAQKKAMHALLETHSGPEELDTRGTGRNWNTPAKLLEVAEGLGVPSGNPLVRPVQKSEVGQE